MLLFKKVQQGKEKALNDAQRFFIYCVY